MSRYIKYKAELGGDGTPQGSHVVLQIVDQGLKTRKFMPAGTMDDGCGPFRASNGIEIWSTGYPEYRPIGREFYTRGDVADDYRRVTVPLDQWADLVAAIDEYNAKYGATPVHEIGCGVEAATGVALACVTLGTTANSVADMMEGQACVF